MLTVGQKAPNFSLPGDDSQIHQLKDFLGKPLVIFFYPKDLTPGCTTEACEFSAHLEEFGKLSAQVIGVSRDSLALHARFKSKHSLRLLLLSDPDAAVHQLYGAYGKKILYGKTSTGVIRSSFLIDSAGNISKVWYKVRVKNHVAAVYDALSRLPHVMICR